MLIFCIFSRFSYLELIALKLSSATQMTFSDIREAVFKFENLNSSHSNVHYLTKQKIRYCHTKPKKTRGNFCEKFFFYLVLCFILIYSVSLLCPIAPIWSVPHLTMNFFFF